MSFTSLSTPFFPFGSRLLDLPNELLKRILVFTSPRDVLALELTCKRLRSVILDSLQELQKFTDRSVLFDWGQKGILFNAYVFNDANLVLTKQIRSIYRGAVMYLVTETGQFNEISADNKSCDQEPSLESLISAVQKVLLRFAQPKRVVINGFGSTELEDLTGILKDVKSLIIREGNSFNVSTFCSFIAPMKLTELIFDKCPFEALDKQLLLQPALQELKRLEISSDGSHRITSDLDDWTLIDMRELRELNAPGAFTNVTKSGISVILREWKMGRRCVQGMCFNFPMESPTETADDVQRAIHDCSENDCRQDTHQHYITGGLSGNEVLHVIVEEREDPRAWHLMVLYGYMQEYWEDGESMHF